MNRKPDWSPEELALLATPNMSNAEIAARTGRSTAAIRGKRQRLAAAQNSGGHTAMAIPGMPSAAQILEMHTAGVPFPKGGGDTVRAVKAGEFPVVKPSPGNPIYGILPDDPAPATYEDDKARVSTEFWKSQHDTLKRKYERALKETSAVDRLLDLVRELSPKSYSSAPPQHRDPSRCGGGKPQSAVLFLSDTHVGQVIEPTQTMGFGEYNFETFLARLKFYEDAVISIIRDHTNTSLDELVVVMGGDMLHGALNHSAEAAQHHTLFSQWFGAGHAFAQFLRNLAPFVPKVRVVCTVGNHTRWGHQHKMPTDNRFSNLDSFVYAYTEALTKDIANVTWSIDTQPVSLFDVQGFKFHLSHGDQLRGGDRALGIPNHAVGRMVSSTAQLFGKDGQPSPHYYLVGHLHRGIVLPHARGSFVVNGGFPGVDGFGLAAGFSPVDPKQVFFLVHPKYGKTATYDIELKFARVGVNRPYSIPGSFI